MPRFLALAPASAPTLALALALALAAPVLRAADPLPGHSVHGEAFDQGPRQAAVLIEGCGTVHFPVTTKSAEAQQFFTQGVGQLHGFWYYEAERSFRQAAMLDPDCAMAYWGCAMANVNNEKRAVGFIAEATKRKDKASKREQAWIAALQNFYGDLKKDKKVRASDFIKELEGIIHDNPEDLEAKAFLAWAIWKGKDAGVTMVSRESVDAIVRQVFAKEPLHPAHHYIIHLWDDTKPARAVTSAALCGQSAPAIAHMWHMPGHTFSKVDRNVDAAWQQDAATRVDHAYMIRTQILPDQIHNYAHNTEWLIRTWNQLGRAGESVALAKNFIEIPRHPTYNTLDKRNGSASYGRTRLLETMLKFELWDDLAKLDGSPWLDISQNPSFEANRLRAVGIAAYFRGDKARLQKALDEVTKYKENAKPTPPATPPATPDKDKNKLEPTVPARLSAENAPDSIDALLASPVALRLPDDADPNFVRKKVDPVIGPDGYTIDLNLAPEAAEFEGFVNYGSPINTTAVDALGKPVTIELTPCLINQPIFSTRKTGVSAINLGGVPKTSAPARCLTVFTAAAKGGSPEKTAAPAAAAPKPAATPAPAAPKPTTTTPPPAATTVPAGTLAAKDAPKGPSPKATVDNAVAELQALLAILDGKKPEDVQKLLDAAKDTPKDRLVRYQLKLGNKDKAATLAGQLSNDAPGLALRVDVLVQCGKMDEAKKQFETARTKAAYLDAGLAMSRRLDALAPQLGFDKAWRKPEAPRADSGVRPPLDSLGPIHWHPWQAKDFTLTGASGRDVSLHSFAGKPVVVLFYLGGTCSHCMEQLKAFTSAARDFEAAGIQIVAIGSEQVTDLSNTSNTCDAKSGAPFPLLSDASLEVFKAWRCHDDFEKSALHGAFLVDGKGQVRWAEIGYDPFQDTKFLLGEAKRLLKF